MNTKAQSRDTFTPGPWICHSGAVWQDGPHVYPKGNADGIPIARMDREDRRTTPVERDNNAKLIAAAPELLDALKVFLEAWDNNDVTTTAAMEAAERQTRMAIAKAEGN
jgi:hypothetical protein